MNLFKYQAVVLGVGEFTNDKGEATPTADILVTDGKSAVKTKVFRPSDVIVAQIGKGIAGLATVRPAAKAGKPPLFDILSAEAADVKMPEVGDTASLMAALLPSAAE